MLSQIYISNYLAKYCMKNSFINTTTDQYIFQYITDTYIVQRQKGKTILHTPYISSN